MKKRILSLLMAFTLCFSVPPTVAPAEMADAAVQETQTPIDKLADKVTEENPAITTHDGTISGSSVQVAENAASVVKVEIDGVTTEYSNIFEAFETVNDKNFTSTAVITLLDNVYLPEDEDERFQGFPGKIKFGSHGSVTLDLNGHLLTQADIGFTDGYTPNVIEMLYGTLTITGEGTIYQRYKTSAISVSSQSTLTIDSDDVTVKADFTYGSKQFPTDSSRAIAVNGGKLIVNGGTFTATSGVALEYTEGTARLNGGTFNGIKIVTYKYPGKINEGVTVTDLLAAGRTYQHTDGTFPADYYVQTISDVKVVEGLVPVPYVDENGAAATATNYIQIEPDTTQWNGGVYVAKGSVTINGGVTVSGKMPSIILCDGASLTVNGGITLPEGRPEALTIYGQSGGIGKMTVTNSGGAAFFCEGLAVLRLLNGTLTATGRDTAFSDVMVWNQLGYGNDEVKCVKTGSSPEAWTDGRAEPSVTISRCTEHQWNYAQHADEERHLKMCALCRYNPNGAETYENCVYDSFSSQGEDGHKASCICGRIENGAALTVHTPAYSANTDGLTHSYRCTDCGFVSGEAEEHSYADGICSICNYACPHEDVDKTVGSVTEGLCADCGKQVYEARLVVDEGKTVEYTETVEEALVRYKNGGPVVTLLCDVDMGTDALVVTYKTKGKALDLGGHTLFGSGDAVFQISQRYGFTIRNGKVENTGEGDAIQLIRGYDNDWGMVDSGNLTVENVTATAAKGWAIQVMDDADYADLNVKSGTLNGGLNAGTISGGHKVQIYGGVFIANPDTHSVYYPGTGLSVTGLVGHLKDMLAGGFTYGNADGNPINYFAEENRTIVGTTDRGYPEGVYLNAETVTIVEHTSHPIDRDSGKCSICGAPCAHIQTDDAGLCTACGVRVMFCESEGRLYKTIQDAQETLKDRTDNPTVKLLDNYGYDVTLLGTANGYTLDLNGFRLTDGQMILYEDRNLTIIDSSEAKTGSVGALWADGGKAVIRDGNFAELIASYEDSIKITGEGTVKIRKIQMLGDYSGSNKKVVADLLNQGYAVYLVDENKKTETLVNGYYNMFNTGNLQQYLPGPYKDADTHLEDGQYYTVKPHTHDFADSTETVCACGYTCIHDSVDADGKCAGCDKVFTAKVTDTDDNTVYYADGIFPESGNTRSGLDIAFANASSGSTVTLLGSNAVGYLDGGKELTLALGGKSVNNLYIGRERSGNSLTVTGTGSIGSVFVHADSKIDLTGWSGNVDSLYVYSGGSATLRGGTFGKVILRGNTAGSLLAPGYAFRYEDGSYVSYTATDDLTKTVSVVPCGYEDWYGSDSSAVCPCCNQTGAVQVPVTSADGTAQYAFYMTLQGAVSNTNRSDSKDDPIVLLRDISGDSTIDRNAFINMNSHSINGALTVNNAEVYFSGSGSTVTAVTMSGSEAKFGLIRRSSVIPGMGKLTIAGGADWGSILPDQIDRYGYKLFKDDNSYEWRDSDTADADAASMTNVSIGRLPIPGTDLEFQVDGSDIVTAEVGTTVQLTATCTTGASVSFYIQKQDGETPVSLAGQDLNGGSYSAEYQFGEVGEYTVWFTGTKDGYTAQSAKKTLNITKLGIPKEAITAPVAKTDLVYNGQEQELVIPGQLDAKYGKILYSWDYNEWGNFSSETIPTKKDAGTYELFYKIIGSDNYKGDTYPTAVNVTIAKRELTVKDVEVMAKTYDGTDTAEFGTVTFDNAPDGETPGYVVQGVYDDSSAGDGRSIDITVKLRRGSDKNYMFADGTDTIVFRKTGLSIAKAGVPRDIQSGALTICNVLDKTYTFDLSALLPPASKGIYGTVTYGKPETTLDTDNFVPDVDSRTGMLTLEVSKRNSSTEGAIGTITVKVSTDNYEDIPLTINVSATNKLVPVQEGAVTAETITYGQTLGESSITGTMKDGDTEISGTFTWQDSNMILTAGTHTDAAWKFTPDDTRIYAEVTGTTTVIVNKAAQSGTVKMENYTYDTTPSTPELTNRTGDNNASVTYYYSTTNSTSGGTKWENIRPATLNAGTYYMYAVIGETDNYNAFTSAAEKFTVGKATPDYTMPAGLTAKYGQKLSEITLTNPSGNLSGTWSWQEPGKVLDEIGTQKYYADFKPDNKNYKEVDNVAIEITIKPADGGILKAETLEQKYTDTSDHTYTPDWSGLPTGQKWTYSSEYSVSNGSTATFARQDVATADGRLTYAISGGKVGDVITITLKAQCANYKDFTITLTITLTGEPAVNPEYRITDGADSSWVQNTDGSLVIKGNGEISKFKNVKVDGKVIGSKNYTVTEGSTIITLKPKFLKTLSEGSHSFEIVWTDGTAKTSFTVAKNTAGGDNNDNDDDDNNKNDNNNKNDSSNNSGSNNTAGSSDNTAQTLTKSPKTGDDSGLWIAIIMASIAGFVLVLVRRKKIVS